MKIYNTYSKKIEKIKPINEGHLSMYCCGPTVYSYAHIGNLRTFLFEDFLKRALLSEGLKVNHVMNITDVGHLSDDGDDGEDKMIRAAKEKGQSVYDIADFFTSAFLKDINNLNILPADTLCRATDNIKAMIKMIKKLEEKGFTYSANSNVYFDTQKFEEYGKMANLDAITENAQHRVEVDNFKKNKRDFVLWFTNSKFENQAMKWSSPWGIGYPGWHIECSAMSIKYLGERIDLHCGAVDAINIHHTNEIAQSEACLDHKWVNYWIHGEFLITREGKMSKSKGKTLTLSLLMDEGYDPLDFRYLCLLSHYRTQMEFTFTALDAARNARISLLNKLSSLDNEDDKKESKDGLKGKYDEDFSKAIMDDLGTPKALSILRLLLKDDNLSSKDKRDLSFKFDNILGLKLKTLCENLVVIEPRVQNLLSMREKAREAKDWSLSDKLRDEIEELGYQIKDSKEGTKVIKKM